ncbi:MAG: hypothetical protein F6K19_12515 [Cyanothece sp. SIO1E1]|nr:hypothetical protein [Cyanothece sp. SIO1E1]
MLTPQKTQLHSPTLNLFTAVPANPHPQQLFHSSNAWFRVVQLHPLILLAGVWTATVLAAAIAFVGLTNISSLESQQRRRAEVVPVAEAPQPSATVKSQSQVQVESQAAMSVQSQLETQTMAPQTAATSQTENILPLWSLLALVLSCAAGCWVTSRLLIKSAPPRKPSGQNTPKPLQRPKAQPHKLLKRLKPYPQPQASAQLAQAQVKLHDRKPNPAKPVNLAKPNTVKPDEAKPIVTVVPAWQSHPLDWDEESLVKVMDIRKQRSLSSLL